MNLEVIILAAGKGTRMYSETPKVLHQIGGKAMLHHVVDTARQLACSGLHIVIGHGAEQIRQSLSHEENIEWVTQAEQLGTGHAVTEAIPAIDDDSTVLVLYGDVPLVKNQSLLDLLKKRTGKSLAVLTLITEDPTGLGRILRDNKGNVTAIVEERDATPEQKEITEINSGIIAGSAAELKRWLKQLNSDNAQNEFLLTDIIAMAVADGINVETKVIIDSNEVMGVNNRLQLSQLERCYQKDIAEKHMLSGVTFADPARVDFRGEIEIGNDVFVDVNVVFEGKVKIGSGVFIGPNVIVKDSLIADNVTIHANSHIEGSIIEQLSQIGPFARLRTGTRLGEETKVGNFVETKKTTLGKGSKISHLSYAGDATIGENVNIGAGTITCNYDGVNKFETHIKDGAFIGSNTSLVAPVIVEENATVAAGSTITSHVPKDKLAVARNKQRNISGWKRPVKK